MVSDEWRKDWWRSCDETNISEFEGKRKEYGSSDLKLMGQAMTLLAPGIDLDTGVEMAVGFYILGKVSRMFGAWEHGLRPSDDTLKDLEIYTRMMRLHREGGLV